MRRRSCVRTTCTTTQVSNQDQEQRNTNILNQEFESNLHHFEKLQVMLDLIHSSVRAQYYIVAMNAEDWEGVINPK